MFNGSTIVAALLEPPPSAADVAAAYRAFALSPEGQVLLRYWSVRFGHTTRPVYSPGWPAERTHFAAGQQAAYQAILQDIKAALEGFSGYPESTVRPSETERETVNNE